MGGGSSVPANTTSTTTVNQSPWQNPTYQALMLGTADKPGPVTSMLRASSALMDQYNALNREGLTPAAQASLGTWNPAVPGSTAAYVNKLDPATGQYVPTPNPTPAPQQAAGGGIMSLRQEELQSFAAGKTVRLAKPGRNETAEQKAKRINDYIQAGGTTLTAADNTFLSNYNTYKDAAAKNPKAFSFDPKTGMPKPSAAPLGETEAQKTARMNAYTKATGLALNDKGVPTKASTAQLQQAGIKTSTTGKAPYNLQDTLSKTAFFDPTTGKSTLPDFLKLQKEIGDLKTPEEFQKAATGAAQAQQGLLDKSNYTAKDVGAYDYTAANMQAPKDIQAQDYTAAQTQGASYKAALAGPAATYNAAMMAAPKDIQAQDYTAAQAAGPTDWTTAQANKYMNPYVETALAAQQRLANMNYAQQNNQLQSQAASQGAFGGSRAQLSLGMNQLNQDIANQNLAAQGMNTAYNTALGAAQTQNQQQMQINLANQAAINQQRQTYVQQALQAAQANQAAQLTTAQQNQIAQNAASQFNATNAQQINLANQAAQNTAGQFNAANQQQANLANQAAINQQRQLYVQQALDAAKVNYGGKLTAAQQNQIAQNAASQFNATQKQTRDIQNQQAGLSANQQNLSALQGASNAATALGTLGTSRQQADLARLNALGQSAQAQQNLAQQYLNNQTQNAQTWLGMPASINAAATNAINTQPATGGINTAQQAYNQPRWGAASGGQVTKHTWASGGPKQKDSWAYISNKGRK